MGDLDRAFPTGTLAQSPFRVEGVRAYGPGIADMKGGLVVLTYAILGLAEAGLPAPAITLVFCPDEQAGSLLSRRVIEAESARADWCLCVECARDGGNLMGSRAHVGVARLDVFGREAYTGADHGRGANAIEALSSRVASIQALADPSRDVYVTVTLIQGGRRRSVVPGHAWCVIDVRTPTASVWAETEQRLRRIAGSEDPGLTTELRIHAHRPGIPWTAGTDRLIAIARTAGRALGVSFEIGRSAAAGSSSFAGARGVPTLDGMGPVGGDLMTDAEYIAVPSLWERAELLALMLHLLAEREAHT